MDFISRFVNILFLLRGFYFTKKAQKPPNFIHLGYYSEKCTFFFLKKRHFCRMCQSYSKKMIFYCLSVTQNEVLNDLLKTNCRFGLLIYKDKMTKTITQTKALNSFVIRVQRSYTVSHYKTRNQTLTLL